jgi:hypothetical protein
MASNSWLPSKELDLQTFCADFSTKITLSPTTYGVLASDATTLAALVATYTSSLATATDPATKTKVTTAAKNSAKIALVAEMRSLAKRIQATPSVTPAQKTTLGLPVHAVHPTPIAQPSTRPVLSVVAVQGQQALIRLVDEATPTKRSKPGDAEGAIVLSYVPAASEAPPSDLEKWSFKAVATKGEVKLTYTPDQVGKTATIRAFWVNPRGEQGPVSDAVTLMIAA